MPMLVCLQKIGAISGLSGRLKAQFLVTHGCFPKKPWFSKSTLNLARFDTKFVAVSKNFAFGLTAGNFAKFGLKALCVSCAFIVRVAEALDHESTNEDFRGCSRDDKPVFLEEINK